jgi:hypothetical protein
VASIEVIPTSLVVTEPDESDLFSISLTSRPLVSVSVPLGTSSSECSVSPSSVTLDATNWATGVSATVTALNDDVADGPQICLVETGPSSSGDGNYDDLNPADVRVTVHDDDSPGIVVDPIVATITEPDGFWTVSFALTTQPAAAVVIPLRTSNGECSISSSSVTLDAANWATGVSATVAAEDDDVADGPQSCLVETGLISSGDNNYDGRDPDNIAVTVEDDDTVGIAVTPTSMTISEPDGSDAFTLTLTSEPGATVFIGVSTTNDECTVTPLSIELDAGNWQTGVRVLVEAEDDLVKDGEQSCVVQTTPTSSADSQYQGLSVDNVAVTVEDNERLWTLYVPSAALRWPPIPHPPDLNPISNPSGLGEYAVTWDPAGPADTYSLEEAKHDTFDDATVVYTGPNTSHTVQGHGAARYYYRVKARNVWGESAWSNVEWVDVQWEAEPNDRAYAEANGPIVSGPTYYGTFPNTMDEKDYFYFELPFAQRCELWLSNIPVQHNYTLVLRDAALNSIAYNPQPSNFDEYILTNLLPAGQYYIQVFRTQGSGSAQPYHLRMVCQ